MKKTYYNLEEISQMKANGYEKSTIDYFTAIHTHYQPLLDCIYDAFKGVKLEDGIGAWEADAIDNYAQAEELARNRDKDERDDWTKLITPELNKCFCSLSYLDAKGMRFCLPAYMIADITDLYQHEIMYSLTNSLANETGFTTYNREQFSLFNRQQKDAVIQYMTYPVADVEKQRYGWHDDTTDAETLEAIKNFWSKYSNRT